MSRRARSSAALALVALAGCGAEAVDLRRYGDARAGCEEPTEFARMEGARMLPGWRCQYCHAGRAARDLPLRAAGTVYNRPDADCNADFLHDVRVDFLDERGAVALTVRTNKSGNFFTADDVPRPYRIRLSKAGRVREMETLQTDTDCASCHAPGGTGGGRVFLQ